MGMVWGLTNPLLLGTLRDDLSLFQRERIKRVDLSKLVPRESVPSGLISDD